MINFQECDIIVNGTGLAADSATLSQENSLSSAFGIGRNKIQMIPAGGLITSVQINYKPQIGKDPNLSIIQNLKTFQSGLSIVNIEIGGIECSGYLSSYSLSISPNQSVVAAASYISFFPTYGEIATKRGTIDYNTDPNLFGHGWTAVSNYGHTGFYPTYSFNYSINFDYSPIYVFNSKYPKQVVFLGGQERISFIKEKYLQLDFYGETGHRDLMSNSQESFNIYELSKYNNQNNSLISFDFRDCKITSSNLRANINDYVKTEISAERRF